MGPASPQNLMGEIICSRNKSLRGEQEDEDETGQVMFSTLVGLPIQGNSVSIEFQETLTKSSIENLTTPWETPKRFLFRQNRCHSKVSFTEKAPRKVLGRRKVEERWRWHATFEIHRFLCQGRKKRITSRRPNLYA